MAIFVPELIFYNLLNGLMKEIKDNYVNTQDKTKTHLYRFWGGLKDGKYDYYENAVNLFARGEENPRHVKTSLAFNRELAKMPTIHVTMPQDQTGENSIGVQENWEKDIIDQGQGVVLPSHERRFDANTFLICTSDNNREVLLMYHTLRAMIISAWNSLEVSGIQNIKLSGQEVRMDSELVPPHIFMRGIGISHSYDVTVSRTLPYPLITQLILNSPTIIDQSGSSETPTVE